MCDSDNGQSFIVDASFTRRSVVLTMSSVAAIAGLPGAAFAANVTETDVMVPTPGRQGRRRAVPSGRDGIVAGGADVARHSGIEAGVSRDGHAAGRAGLYGPRPQPLLSDQARTGRHWSCRFQRSEAGRASDEPQGDPDRCRDRQATRPRSSLSSTSRNRPTRARVRECRAIASAAPSRSIPGRFGPTEFARSPPSMVAASSPRSEQPTFAHPKDEGELSLSRSRAMTIRSSPKPRMC